MGNKKSKFAALFQEYPDVVSVPQLCKMLGVCKGNAYQLLHSGQIKYLRVGQVYRIPKLCVIDSQSSKSGLGLVDAKPVSEFVPSIYLQSASETSVDQMFCHSILHQCTIAIWDAGFPAPTLQ